MRLKNLIIDSISLVRIECFEKTYFVLLPSFFFFLFAFYKDAKISSESDNVRIQRLSIRKSEAFGQRKAIGRAWHHGGSVA